MKHWHLFLMLFCLSCNEEHDPNRIRFECTSEEGVYPRIAVMMTINAPCPSITTALADYTTGETLCDSNGCNFQTFQLSCKCLPPETGW